MSEKPKVYFTKVVSPEKLIEVYEKLNIKLEGNIAVKVHSGEKGNKNFIKPEFIKPGTVPTLSPGWSLLFFYRCYYRYGLDSPAWLPISFSEIISTSPGSEISNMLSFNPPVTPLSLPA